MDWVGILSNKKCKSATMSKQGTFSTLNISVLKAYGFLYAILRFEI